MIKKYDALAILGGGLKNDNGRWRTTNFNESDDFGIAGDRIRVVAGAILFLRNLSDIIIALGGRGQYESILGVPPIAEVLKQELIELGVPHNKIILEIQSGNTHQQLKFVNLLVKLKNMGTVCIISNEWHLPRIRAILEHSPYLEGLASHLELLSGEEIAIQYDKANWESIIIKARRSNEMKKRIALEQKGIIDIKEERYKFT